MDILTIASQKGGVGKTALALNLGWAFSRSGRRTLVVDVDPQSGLSRSIAAQLVERKGIHDVLQKRAQWNEVVLPTRIEGFGVMPLGRVQPWEAAEFEAQITDGSVFHSLRDALSSQWDLLIIDTPAGLGSATLGALRASDFVVSPLQAEPGALRCANALMETVVYLAHNEGCHAQFLGFVLGMVDKSNTTSSAIVGEAWRTFPSDLILDTTIPRHGAFLEATSKGVPVGALPGEGRRLGLIFEQLVAELTSRMETYA